MWHQVVIPTVLFGFMVLSSCHELSENGENGMLEKLRAFGSIRNPRSSGNATSEQSEAIMWAEMKKSCDKNGGPQAFAYFQNAYGEMKTCVKSVADIEINYERLAKEFVMPGKTFVADSVRKGCHFYHKVDDCIRGAVETLKACLVAEDRVAVQQMQNISSSVMGYVCKDNGAEILAFYDNRGVECVMMNIQGLAGCIKTLTPEKTNAQPTNKVDEERALSKFMEFKYDDCSEINTLQTCVKENLEKCNVEQPARFVDGIFEAFKRPTPCKDAPRALTISSEPSIPSGSSIPSGTSIPSAPIILPALAFAYLSSSKKWF